MVERSHEERWSVSVAFWIILLAAGTLFACVSLAPRLKTLAELQQEFATNQLRLVALERRANELEDVVGALERDPQFTAELSKLEFSAVRTGHERIPLPRELHLGAGRESASEAAQPRSHRLAIPRFVVEPLATHRGLRAALLASAALLVLVGFLLLHEDRLAMLRTWLSRASTVSDSVARRYRRL